MHQNGVPFFAPMLVQRRKILFMLSEKCLKIKSNDQRFPIKVAVLVPLRWDETFRFPQYKITRLCIFVATPDIIKPRNF